MAEEEKHNSRRGRNLARLFLPASLQLLPDVLHCFFFDPFLLRFERSPSSSSLRLGASAAARQASWRAVDGLGFFLFYARRRRNEESLLSFSFSSFFLSFVQRPRMPAPPPPRASARSSRTAKAVSDAAALAAENAAPVCASAEFLPAAAREAAGRGGKENAAKSVGGGDDADANAVVASVAAAKQAPLLGFKRSAAAQDVVSVRLYVVLLSRELPERSKEALDESKS